MSKLNKIISLFLGILLIAGTIGCTSPTTTTTTVPPVLPNGFSSAAVPDVNMDGYLYIGPSSPITIPVNNIPGVTTDISLNSLALWLGPDTSSLGESLSLNSDTAASTIVNLLKNTKGAWLLASGSTVYVSRDTGDWNISLRNAVTSRSMVNPATKYADIWRLFNYFPANPPLSPLAAGFLNIGNNTLLDSLQSSGIAILDTVQAIKTVGINNIDFMLYGTVPTELPQTMSADMLKNYSILLVGKSGYSAVLMNAAFDKIVENLSLTKSTLDNFTVYSYQVGGTQVLISRNGNVLYASFAQTLDMAQRLLLSTLNK